MVGHINFKKQERERENWLLRHIPAHLIGYVMTLCLRHRPHFTDEEVSPEERAWQGLAGTVLPATGFGWQTDGRQVSTSQPASILPHAAQGWVSISTLCSLCGQGGPVAIPGPSVGSGPEASSPWQGPATSGQGSLEAPQLPRGREVCGAVMGEHCQG